MSLPLVINIWIIIHRTIRDYRCVNRNEIILSLLYVVIVRIRGNFISLSPSNNPLKIVMFINSQYNERRRRKKRMKSLILLDGQTWLTSRYLEGNRVCWTLSPKEANRCFPSNSSVFHPQVCSATSSCFIFTRGSWLVARAACGSSDV